MTICAKLLANLDPMDFQNMEDFCGLSKHADDQYAKLVSFALVMMLSVACWAVEREMHCLRPKKHSRQER